MLSPMVLPADENSVANTYSEHMRSRPLVVFLDSYSWQAFVDLAGALRHRHVRVARVAGRSTSLRVRLVQRMEAWVFGRLHRRVEGGTLHGTTAVISPADLSAAIPADAADVQMQEDLVLSALELGSGPAHPSRHLAPGVDPRILVDKRLQIAQAAAVGVPVPRQWDEPTSATFPVVVKTPIGFGGGGVRVARDQAGLDAAWAELSANDGNPFVQEHLGRGVSTGGVAQDGEPLVCVAYDGRPAPDDPTGPSQVIVAVDNAEAVANTAAFLRSIGYTGFFCLDWVTGPDGRLRLIDFNARVFGSWVALQDLGFDLVGAYLHVIGAGPAPEASVGKYGVAAPMLRYPCPPAETREDVMRWRAETLEVVRARRSWLGSRWAAVIRMRTVLGTARALGKVHKQSRSAVGASTATTAEGESRRHESSSRAR